MVSLSLDVIFLTCGGDALHDDTAIDCPGWCTAQLGDAIERTDSRSDAFVVLASSVSLAIDKTALTDKVACGSTLAMFIPPSLTESTEFRNNGNHSQCRNTYWIEPDIGETLLQRVHSLLCEYAKVRGIVSVSESHIENRPSDILLLDVSSASPSRTSHILSTLNGESIASQPDMVLKIFPLTNVRFMHENEATARSQRGYEIPTCPICLHRIDPRRLGLFVPKDYQLCSKFCIQDTGHGRGLCRNHRFLCPWPQPSHCSACQTVHGRWTSSRENSAVASLAIRDELGDTFCNRCALQETLWVCLTCGFVGCGRYSQRHAAEHFQESGHPYSLELATLRIWDYTNGEFAHRADLLECPSIQYLHMNLTAVERKPIEGALVHIGNYDESMQMVPRENPYPVTFDEAAPKKANMIGEEYETLLQSALEDQAQHYEGELTRLRAALTSENVDRNQMTKDETEEVENLKADVSRYRLEIERLGRQLLDAQGHEAEYRAASQRLLREQSVATDLLDTIRAEAARENDEGKVQVEELEQQIDDLTANLRMRQQFSKDQDLNNAQIFGTVSSGRKSTKKGKKTRRFFRK